MKCKYLILKALCNVFFRKNRGESLDIGKIYPKSIRNGASRACFVIGSRVSKKDKKVLIWAGPSS